MGCVECMRFGPNLEECFRIILIVNSTFHFQNGFTFTNQVCCLGASTHIIRSARMAVPCPVCSLADWEHSEHLFLLGFLCYLLSCLSFFFFFRLLLSFLLPLIPCYSFFPQGFLGSYSGGFLRLHTLLLLGRVVLSTYVFAYFDVCMSCESKVVSAYCFRTQQRERANAVFIDFEDEMKNLHSQWTHMQAEASAGTNNWARINLRRRNTTKWWSCSS